LISIPSSRLEKEADMDPEVIENLFTDSTLRNLFPEEKADLFFDAMYGDVSEGAYDIELSLDGLKSNRLEFHFNLRRRPEKCLACNLTYGLPHVFSRHPLIDTQGLVNGIEKILNGIAICKEWDLHETLEISSDLHVIPLIIKVQAA
jgi:hypothetical protein